MKSIVTLKPTSICCGAVLAVLTAACATDPPRDAGASAAAAALADCAQLSTQIAASREQRRAALDRQQDAWKVVVPFAVAARYVSAQTTVADLDQRLADLNADFERQGCTRP